jgi:outer membrane protein
MANIRALRQYFFTLILCLGLGGEAFAEAFSEALAKAYQSNPTLAAARAQLRVIDEGVSQALGLWRPSISLSYEVGKDWRDLSGNSVTGSRNRDLTPRTTKASVVQKIYDGGQTNATVDSAEAEVKAQRARLILAEQNVLFDAGSAYLDVFRDQAVLELNRNNEAVLKRQFQATKDRFEVGEVTKTDVSLAEARFSGSVAARIAAEGQLANSRASFRRIIGSFPNALSRVVPLGGIPESQKAAISIARDRSPALIAARYRESSARFNVKKLTGAFLPSVSVEGGVSRSEESSSQDTRTDSLEILATIKIPLYQRGIVSSETREAKHTLTQRRLELDAAIQDSVEKATRAWESLVSTRARIKALISEISASQIALEGVKQEAQVGSRTVLDVLDAEQELLDARVKLVGAERSEVVATMELHRSLGSLTAKDLKLPVKFYDPDKNYNQSKNKIWGTSVE